MPERHPSEATEFDSSNLKTPTDLDAKQHERQAEQEQKQERVRQALLELHTFSETMRHVPATYRREIRDMLAGIEIMLNGELASAMGERYSPYPANAREQFQRAVEPLGFVPKSAATAETK